MKIPAPRSLIGYLIAVFVVGLAVGGAAGYTLGVKFRAKLPTAEQVEAGWMDKLRIELSLSKEQCAQIQPVIARGVQRLGKVWRQAMSQMEQVGRETQREIEPFLDPTQRVKLAEMEARERAKRARTAEGEADAAEPATDPKPAPTE